MPKLIQLSPSSQQNTGFTHKSIFNAADVAALTSGTAYSVLPQKNAAGTWVVVASASAATVPAGTLVEKVALRVTTAFASAGNTITLVAIVGDGGDTSRYFASTSLKTAGYPVSPPLKVPLLYVTADTIDIIFTAAVEAITLLTAGEVEVYLALRDLDALSRPNILANA